MAGILIVTHDPQRRSQIELALAAADLPAPPEFAAVDEPRAARELLASRTYDLVLVDAELPGQGAWSLCTDPVLARRPTRLLLLATLQTTAAELLRGLAAGIEVCLLDEPTAARAARRAVERLSRPASTAPASQGASTAPPNRLLQEVLDDLRHASQLLLEERRQRQQAVADVDRCRQELHEFLHAVSHDLTAPLRAVAGFCQLLERRYGQDLSGEAREFLQFAIGGAQDVQRMIGDLLTLYRVDARPVSDERAQAEAACDEAIQELQPLIAQTGANVTRAALPRVAVQHAQLVQVFHHLIDNALKYRDATPPQVHVAARQEDGRWLFSVQDNGTGIDPKNGQAIFSAFRRLVRDEQCPGSGIGLAICQKIVQRYGGRIWVESQPGAGSTFWFTLPGGDAAPRVKKSPGPKGPNKSARG